MLRKVLPLMFVMIFISTDTALAWRHHLRCRRTKCCCPVKHEMAEKGPNYCLQTILMDFAGSYDLYDCITYDDGCPTPPDPDSPYEDLYFGQRSSELHYPEDCPDCETGGGWSSGHGGKPPGHQSFPSSDVHQHDTFHNKASTCAWLRRNYPPRQNGGHNVPCTYIKITHSSLSQVFYAVVVPAYGNRVDFVGVETELFQDPPDPIELTPTISNPKVTGKVLYFEVGALRYLIWLR